MPRSFPPPRPSSSDLARRSTLGRRPEALNRFHSNVRWSQRDNFVSVPTDCPQRNVPRLDRRRAGLRRHGEHAGGRRVVLAQLAARPGGGPNRRGRRGLGGARHHPGHAHGRRRGRHDGPGRVGRRRHHRPVGRLRGDGQRRGAVRPARLDAPLGRAPAEEGRRRRPSFPRSRSSTATGSTPTPPATARGWRTGLQRLRGQRVLRALRAPPRPRRADRRRRRARRRGRRPRRPRGRRDLEALARRGLPHADRRGPRAGVRDRARGSARPSPTRSRPT